MASSVFNLVHVTHNTVSVTWQLLPHRPDGFTTLESFALVSETYPITFTISVIHRDPTTITLQSSRNGRAIVKLSAECAGRFYTEVTLLDHWKIYSFFTIEGIFPPTGTAQTLRISCIITWLGPPILHDERYHTVEPLSLANVPFDNQNNPDFKIIVDGQTLFAHKAILARHSHMLDTMFRVPMKEANENRMIIEDFDYSTMAIILKIIYTGNSSDLNPPVSPVKGESPGIIPIDIETALMVLSAAHQYQMPMVKTIAEYNLQMKIRDDNVMKILEMAELYRAEKLCFTCVDYITVRQEMIAGHPILSEMSKTRPLVKAALGDLALHLVKLVKFR
uniref:BTB domain-containing protein n=1 Tax=Bracon brevicornis TaxID=1563983 RepID=A0A6V7HQ65_9HYME